MSINQRDQIWKRLRDPEFRKQFIDEFINVGIAFQIRQLRERRKLTQTDLAERMGNKKKQPLLSSWENPDYGKYTLATLKEIAKALDVGLLVQFVPFSELVDRTINVTSDTISPPSFGEEDQALPAVARDENENLVTRWVAPITTAGVKTEGSATDYDPTMADVSKYLANNANNQQPPSVTARLRKEGVYAVA